MNTYMNTKSIPSIHLSIARPLFITHFTPLSPWRGVGGEALSLPLERGWG